MRYVEMSNQSKFDLKQEFNNLNGEIFNGELELVFPLHWIKLKNAMGRVSYTRYRATGEIIITKLVLSTFFDVTAEVLRNIMIHEMVHVYFLQILSSLEGHGFHFMKKIADINRKFSHYNVQRTEDVSDYDVEPSVFIQKTLNFYLLHSKKRKDILIGVYRNLDRPDKSFKSNFKHFVNFKGTDIYKVEYGKSDLLDLQRFKLARTLGTSIRSGIFNILTDKQYQALSRDVEGTVF